MCDQDITQKRNGQRNGEFCFSGRCTGEREVPIPTWKKRAQSRRSKVRNRHLVPRLPKIIFQMGRPQKYFFRDGRMYINANAIMGKGFPGEGGWYRGYPTFRGDPDRGDREARAFLVELEALEVCDRQVIAQRYLNSPSAS